jgi:hypothetical protein
VKGTSSVRVMLHVSALGEPDVKELLAAEIISPSTRADKVQITATASVTADCVSLVSCCSGRRRRTNKPIRAPPRIATNETKPINDEGSF